MFQAPSDGASTSRRQASDIEPEERDLAILHDVVASFEPHLATLPSGGIGARRDEVIVGHDLRFDESTLDVAVDDARGLGRLRALAHRPGTYLRIACRQEGDEVEQAIGGME